MILLEFVVDGPPVSQQTRRRDRLRDWRRLVRQEAEKHWLSTQKPTTNAVMLQVTYFYDSIAIDVDNIIKPIQDAMIGLVYIDDDQVSDVLVRKRNLSGKFRVVNLTSILAEGFSRGNEFLHIVVTDTSIQEVIF